ncbi:unnamed protein product [Rangifer tarandus platyrhynchus]|uniref:Uncharacterized protein n=2 Tax=Rangifer tarandus platyrhynchus TaxID=3082113 RepID=A0ABN8Z3A2_RANTA|nr:unnamed protein product [Rangifer tarandus platyrhynchus]CAI9704659.1 unnamed protein product [Rangifer tarandus platyrhynchus]
MNDGSSFCPEHRPPWKAGPEAGAGSEGAAPSLEARGPCPSPVSALRQLLKQCALFPLQLSYEGLGSLRNALRHHPGVRAEGPCTSRLAEDPDGPKKTEPHFRVWKRSSEHLPVPAYGVSGRMRGARPPLRDWPNLPLNN